MFWRICLLYFCFERLVNVRFSFCSLFKPHVKMLDFSKVRALAVVKCKVAKPVKKRLKVHVLNVIGKAGN